MIITDISDNELCNNQSFRIELLKKGFSKKIISEFKEKIMTSENIDPELIFFHCLANKLVSPCEDKILGADIIFINGPSGSGKTTLCSKIASYILDNKLVVTKDINYLLLILHPYQLITLNFSILEDY